jgi:aspartate/glutamate racemase
LVFPQSSHQDSLVATRNTINQSIFERAASNAGIRLLEEEDEDILDLATEQATNPQIANFLHELALVDLINLTVNFETDEERVFLDNVEAAKHFELSEAS